MNGLEIIFFTIGVLGTAGAVLFGLWLVIKPITRMEDSRLKEWSERKGLNK
tara:strand:- start:1694 stop:1846 length:153 start_codon:yes stop_codon:yes gene_type:complete